MPPQNNADRFVKLWTVHEPQIRGCILLWVPAWSDAQDVAQQVSLVLWRKFDQLQPGTSFLAWALAIAKLESKNYWKRQARERRLFSDRFVDIVAQEASVMVEDMDQRRNMLKYCIDRLKPPQRQMLLRRYLQDETVEEIARMMDRSVDSVYKAIARVRSSLLKCVGRQMALASRP